MPIRNPFRRNADEPASTATLRPGTAGAPTLNKLPSFERVDTVGSSASSRRSQDTGDYKMSVVDSGVYLPPSPTERDAFWSGPGPRRTYITSLSTLSRTSTDRSSSLDIEPFSISRESFDSYRRSFDISAKSPVTPVSPTSQMYYGDSINNTRIVNSGGRQSLDSAMRHNTSPRGRPSVYNRFPPADEGFEEVGLEDNKPAPAAAPASSSGMMHAPAFMRKRGFFKFGSEDAQADTNTNGSTTTNTSSAPIGRLLGRKRAQSGQGAELAPMDKSDLPATSEQDGES